MSLYKRVRQISDALRGITSKLKLSVVKLSPPPRPPPRISYRSNFLISSLIPSQSNHMHGGGVGRLRFYSINQHRGASHHWLLNRRVVSSLVILGVGIRFYFKNLETVPFTNRTHFVIFPKLKENSFGEESLEDMKEEMKHKVKIFPPDHPDSVRVRLIAEKIIGALHRELRKKRIWSAPQYDLGIWDSKCEGALMALIGWWNAWKNGVLGDDWGGSSIKVSVESQTRFLEALNWEILMVSSGPAFCLMGGKLIFSTEYMKYLTTDAEIATIIGHEVGHAVARHMAEMVAKEHFGSSCMHF